jgi:hypothetical protein
VAIRGQGALGAPVTIALEDLLAQAPHARATWLDTATGRAPTGNALAALRAARTIDDAHGALDRLIDRRATPDRVPAGALVMQPGDERRASGSHYTPRELTAPIVKRTLDPQLDRLRPSPGVSPTADAILDLKVCDPAMGSGAFLVETCRHLGDAVVQAWATHGGRPRIPADEDEVVHARRLVAQKCIYGVDRNPMAVELAKVSIWLATLARDHAFTFIDHALRHGDSLVGLTDRQLQGLNWDATATPLVWLLPEIHAARDRLSQARGAIRDAPENEDHETLARLLADADATAADVQCFGDVVIGAFFDADKPATRRNLLESRTFGLQGDRGASLRAALLARRTAHPPFVPFHWHLVFPEVFDRSNPGFDAFVGNPPFAGSVAVVAVSALGYVDWLRSLHEESQGKCDLVAHFFRRAFNLLRTGGTLGLIATNTIAQGDTRASGLRWICTHGGDIYHATRRKPWPGVAAVIVSVVHLARGPFAGQRYLDGAPVDAISAFLVPGTMHNDPARLAANFGKQFEGAKVNGMGFTFEEGAPDDVGDGPPGTPTSIRRMQELLRAHPEYAEVVMPYIGGAEVNSNPTHAHRRYVINFGQRTEEACWDRYPDLMAIAQNKVRPERLTSTETSRSGHGARAAVWWQFVHHALALRAAIAGLDRVLVTCIHTPQLSLAFLRSGAVFSHALIVFPFQSYAAFAALQSGVHDLWARFFGSSMKDDLRYTPTDCFETFPFPPDWEARPDLEAAGRAYYEYRAALMVANNEGLTKTYNRFHTPDDHDPQIARLRTLHAAMDRAVLDAYGWGDVPVACEFIEENPPADDDEAQAGGARGRARARKWRYRWPEAVREEVLGRLLALNAARAAAEASDDEAAAMRATTAPARPRGRPRGNGGAGVARGSGHAPRLF